MIIERTLRIENFLPKYDFPYLDPAESFRLLADDVELSNCIKFAEWDTDPINPILCSECLIPECGANGMAHVFRTETELIWMPPYQSWRSWPEWDEIELFRSIRETYLFRATEWKRLCQSNSLLPPFESFPVVTNHDLYHLWLQQRPDFAIPSRYESFHHHLQRHVVASHPLEIQPAFDVISSKKDEMNSPAIPQAGSFVPISEITEEFNSLYFDGDGLQEFITFTVAAPHRLVIGGQYVLLP